MYMNWFEVESKILDVDRSELEKQILKLWWKKIFDGELTAILLQNEAGYKIRARQEWNNGIAVEHKQHLPNTEHFTYAYETWFIWDNLESIAQTFEKLWFLRKKFDVKNRVSYILALWYNAGNARYDFDYYTDTPVEIEIPEFVEIEWLNEQQVIMWAQLIWYELSDLKWWSMSQVVEHYRNKQLQLV